MNLELKIFELKLSRETTYLHMIKNNNIFDFDLYIMDFNNLQKFYDDFTGFV